MRTRPSEVCPAGRRYPSRFPSPRGRAGGGKEPREAGGPRGGLALSEPGRGSPPTLGRSRPALRPWSPGGEARWGRAGRRPAAARRAARGAAAWSAPLAGMHRSWVPPRGERLWGSSVEAAFGASLPAELLGRADGAGVPEPGAHPPRPALRTRTVSAPAVTAAALRLSVRGSEEVNGCR